ncbi:MAG: hypothetical protein LLG04_03720 [Parachlamydia sp.]|nr:hypothetical protein [Parachlamydia sp.]
MILSCISPSFGRFEEPVLTTQDYFALALSKKALQEKPALAKRLREIKRQHTTAMAAKVVWATTIVLPIFYFLGTLIFKPTFSHQKTRDLLALKKSVGEFGEILEIVGCKKEREEEKRTHLPKYNWVVYDIRQDALYEFMRSYENQKVFLQAIFKTTESMLKHFKAHFAVDGYKWLQNPENAESDKDLAINYAYFIRRIHEHSHPQRGNKGIRYLKGDEAFHQGWDYLTSRKERMMQLCNRMQRR